MWNTEAELLAACADQTIAESHYVEAKKLVGASAAANKELARDLAQFAIDGGHLVIGIEENKDSGVFTPRPFEINGVPERIESIAATRCDPPLSVLPRSIRASDDNVQGYVVVEIPPSPLAPHMVDGRYLARGETAKRYLTNSEVVAMHTLLQQRAGRTKQELIDYMSRDPIPNGSNSHLFVVAVPLGFLDEAQTDSQSLYNLASAAHEMDVLVRSGGGGWTPPNFAEAGLYSPRPDGGALSAGLDSARIAIAQYKPESSVSEFELSELGAIRVYSSRLSDVVSNSDYVMVSAAVQAVHQVLEVALAVGRANGYVGQWGLAIAGTNLLGRQASGQFGGNWPMFSAENYVRSTSFSTSEAQSLPEAIAARVLQRFCTAFGELDAHRAALGVAL